MPRQLNNETLLNNVKRGDFPFPLTKGPVESPYLTWLRNHSNYMAAGGFMDYLRIGGVLVRGILINFLILLSLLLLVSLAVGYLYRAELRPPWDPDRVHHMLGWVLDAKKPLDQWLTRRLSLEGDYKEALRGLTGAQDKWWEEYEKWWEEHEKWLDNKKKWEAAQAKWWEAEKENPINEQGSSDKTKLDTAGREWHEAETKWQRVDLAWHDADLDLDLARAKLKAVGAKGAESKVENDLALLINRQWIHSDYTFRGVDLTPETIGLIDTYPDGVELRRLNRLLLEEAYPAALRQPVPPTTLGEAEKPVPPTTFGKLLGWVGKTLGVQEDLPPPTPSKAGTSQASPTSSIAATNSVPLATPGKLLRWVKELWDWIKEPNMPDPFHLTGWVCMVSVFWIVFSPIWVVFGQIRGQKKSSERAGSDSSVEGRDRFERTFGVALLLVLACAAFETLPILVNQFHQFVASPKLPWNTIFVSAGGVSVAVMGGAGKLLSVLGGAKKKLAMLLIGLLGLLVPLLVILYVTDFLVYHELYRGWLNWLLFVIPAALIVLTGGAMAIGKINKSFKSKEYLRLLGLFVGLIIGMIGISFPLWSHEGPRNYYFNYYFVLVLAIELWVFCRLIVDVNSTAFHGLYRDRLAAAYLVGLDTKGDIGIEEDTLLGEICCHETGSTAPYHLINVALNLQGSKDKSIRDRHSDFFIFSKRFIGGHRTGYCRTTTMEQVHPAMNLAGAMAISAAAASPNMGRSTNPLLVSFMVLLNIRLGYWLSNPGRLEEALAGDSVERIKNKKTRQATKTAPGWSFKEVFEQELVEIEKRWNRVYPDDEQRKQRRLHTSNNRLTTSPTTEHGLVGIGFSGGGIRSATINLGIAQALYERGVFDHVDYMSTVSGGGYLGSSISALMRSRAFSDVEGKLSVTTDPATRDKIVRVEGTQGEVSEYRYARFAKLDDAVKDGAVVTAGQRLVKGFGDDFYSEIDGKVSLDTDKRGEKIVKVTNPSAPEGNVGKREYRFSKFDLLAVKAGDSVKEGQALIEPHNSLWDRFRWRVRPLALVREMMMRLDETSKWVNLSDGGHIENLAGIELLRRRCKFIIIGDGEADPQLAFNGLATLIRYARIDLGINIDIHPDKIGIDRSREAIDEGKSNISKEHWAFGTITYPPDKDNGFEQEEGYLLYLKSSCTGDEDEVIKEYRHSNPGFPHQSTADQFFDEAQFECYRALGQHIAEKAGDVLSATCKPDLSSFETFAEAMNGCAGNKDGRERQKKSWMPFRM